MNSFARLLALTPFVLLVGNVELHAAPTEAQQQAIRSSCQSDYRTYCASVPTGGSAALQCLEQNVASLSSSCQQAVKAATGGSSTAAPEGGSSSSTTTTTTAPATEAPASGSAADSGTPVVIVLEPGQAVALMRQACGADYRAHCNGVRILGGGALQCLISHVASLSASCKSELGRLGQKF